MLLILQGKPDEVASIVTGVNAGLYGILEKF